MSLIKRMRKQKAVYWAPTGTGEDGQPVYRQPVEIKCRWEDVIVQFKDYKGRETSSRARVYVDRLLACGGVLWQGTVAGLTSQSEPFNNPHAYEILSFGTIPNLRNSENLYTVFL